MIEKFSISFNNLTLIVTPSNEIFYHFTSLSSKNDPLTSLGTNRFEIRQFVIFFIYNLLKCEQTFGAPKVFTSNYVVLDKLPLYEMYLFIIISF